MAVNSYFANNYPTGTTSEQNLLEDLIVECIKIYGHDIRYIPRESYEADDAILGENPTSKFTSSYVIEVYLSNVEGYEGDGDYFSKFGLEIRDTSNFIMSRKSFETYVPSNVATRPREGDLMFVPVLNKLFEIKFVEEELAFFSLGKRNPYIYELRCEVFRYSNEDIDTGVEEIDSTETKVAYTQELRLGTGSGTYTVGEVVYQGSSLMLAEATADVKTWTANTKILEIINSAGTFDAGYPVVGVTSNASYLITTTDDLIDLVDEGLSDNRVLQDEADEFIVTTFNPFGEP